MTLYRIGAGEACLLTTSSLIGDEPLPAEGLAETDVEARIVPKAAFERLIAEDPEFRRECSAHLRQPGHRPRRDHAGRALSRHARTAREGASRAGKRRVVEATHQAIAAELGSAREVVSRMLQKFERDGLIAMERGRIVIRDAGALRRMAAPEP